MKLIERILCHTLAGLVIRNPSVSYLPLLEDGASGIVEYSFLIATSDIFFIGKLVSARTTKQDIFKVIGSVHNDLFWQLTSCFSPLQQHGKNSSALTMQKPFDCNLELTLLLRQEETINKMLSTHRSQAKNEQTNTVGLCQLLNTTNKLRDLGSRGRKTTSGITKIKSDKITNRPSDSIIALI